MGTFGNSEGNINGRKKNPQNRCLATTDSGEVAQTLVSTTSYHQLAGAGQEGAGCTLRVTTRPECPEDNLRELT